MAHVKLQLGILTLNGHENRGATLGLKTPAEQAINQIHDEEMRVRRATLADGRYFIFYEFVRSEQLDNLSGPDKGEPTHSATEKEAGV